MKKIIVPIDFSPVSINAFEYALKLADSFLCEIEVVHIYSITVSEYPYMPPDILHMMIEGKEDAALIKFTEYIKSLSGEIAELFHKVPVNLQITSGTVIRSIVELTTRLRGDLIIMGTKGATGLKETFFGSITGEVMEAAPCPVLGIPEDAKFEGINAIAVTTDFSDEDSKVINYLQNWANRFRAEIKCIHVDLKHTHKYTQKMDCLVSMYGENRNISFDVLDGINLYTEILDFVENNDIDILAMVIHQRNMFQELFNLSYTKKMVYHTKRPILAMPAVLFK